MQYFDRSLHDSNSSPTSHLLPDIYVMQHMIMSLKQHHILISTKTVNIAATLSLKYSNFVIKCTLLMTILHGFKCSKILHKVNHIRLGKAATIMSSHNFRKKVKPTDQ